MRAVAKTEAQVDAALKETKDGKEEKEKRDAPKVLKVERAFDGLYSIRFTAGGEVPDVLKGRWTSIIKAQAAVDNYLIGKEVGA